MKSSFTVKLLSFDDKQKIALIKEIKSLLPDTNLVQVLNLKIFMLQVSVYLFKLKVLTYLLLLKCLTNTFFYILKIG